MLSTSIMESSTSDINTYLFDANPTPMIIFHRDSLRILKVNSASEKKYGYSKEEFTQMTVKDIRLWEDIPVLMNNLNAAEDKELKGLHFRHQTKDGHIFYVQINSRNFQWNGQPAQLAVVHDVSNEIEAQIKAEKAGKEAEEQRKFSNMLIRNLPDAFWLMDKGGKVAHWNKQLEKTSGFSKEEIHNRFILDFFVEGERSKLEEALSEAFSEGKATAEGTLITKDGEAISHALTGIKFMYGDEPYIAGIGVNIEAQKNYQQKLEKTKEQLIRAQNIAKLGSWEMSFDDMKLTWSDQMYDLFGLSKDDFDLTWENFLEYVPAEDRSKLREDLKDAMTGALDSEIEHRIITSDGEIRHVVERGEVDFDAHGKPVKVRGTTQDITKRKKAQNELEKSQKNLKRAQEIAKVGSFEWNVVQNKIDYSEEAYSIYEIEKSSEKNLGIDDFLNVIHPDDREFVNKQMKHILGDNRFKEFEHRLLTKNGNEKYVMQRGSVKYDEDGSVIKVFGTVQDITEQKKDEYALKEEKLRFQLATKSTSDVIWDWDFSENKIWWSEGLGTIFGYKDYKAAADPDWWEEQIHFEDRERAEKSINNFLTSNRRYWALSYKFCNADGSISYVEENGYAIRDENGRPVRMIGAMSDITEKKKSELRIRKALEEKEALLAEVHHRVKNNLAIISGLLELQIMNEEDGHVQHLLKDSQSRIFSMAKVHEMLYKSDDFTNISFEQYIVQILDHISDSLMTEKIEFYLENTIEGLCLDINQAIPCALIINEVINNAIEHAFIGKKSGNISISLKKAGEQLRIEISDDGVGMPEIMLGDDCATNSLGHTLIDTLTGQINGESRYSINNKGGTRFELKFKPNKKKGSANTYF